MIKGVINRFRKATWPALVVHGVPAVAIVAAAVDLVAAAGVEYWASTAKPGLGNVLRSVSVILFGVGCSVIASALYVIYTEVAREWKLKLKTSRFLQVFSAPGVSGYPACYVVVQQQNHLLGDRGNEGMDLLALPLPIHWAVDIRCANAVQGLVISLGGQFPELVTPEEAEVIVRDRVRGPAVFFSIGVNSNAFSSGLCQAGPGRLSGVVANRPRQKTGWVLHSNGYARQRARLRRRRSQSEDFGSPIA